MSPASRPSIPRWWSDSPTPAQNFLLAAMLHERPLPAAWMRGFEVSDEHIDALLAARALRETPAGLTAAEELTGVDPAGLAPWSQRRQVHLLLGRLCRGNAMQLEAAGQHFEAAGETAEAAASFLAAAEIHCQRHHHAAAKRCFFRGLHVLPHTATDETVVKALHGLARCASLAEEPLAAANDLRNWFSLPPWLDRPIVRAEANLVLAGLLSHEGRHVESARSRRAAARDLAALGRDRESAEAAFAAATGLAYTGQSLLAREAIDAAVHAAARVGDPDLSAKTQTMRGLILGMLGETEEGLAEVRAALALALEHRLTGAAAEAYRLLGSVQEYASLYPDEQTAFASALKYCRDHDERHTAGICLGCLSYSYLRSGRWQRSEETARNVLGDRRVPLPSRAVAQSVYGLLLVHRGEIRPATRLLQQSLTSSRKIGLLLMDFFNLPGLALLAEMQSDLETAAARYRELIEFWRGTDDRHDAIPGLSAAVTFFATHQRRDDAAAAAEALDRIAALTANPESAGAAHAAAAELLMLDGQFKKSADGFRRALLAYEKRELALEPIQARVRLATALRRLGASGEARALVSEARVRARRLGARLLLAQADAALAVPDASVPTPADPVAAEPGAWQLLSTRQRDVAREIARGLTNKEIAGHLGVSVRTVDMHVAHVLARLDCRTRAEAAAKVTAALR